MKKNLDETSYTIEITETLTRIITISAKNDSEALFKIKEHYNNEDIVLNNENHLSTEFTLL